MIYADMRTQRVVNPSPHLFLLYDNMVYDGTQRGEVRRLGGGWGGETDVDSFRFISDFASSKPERDHPKLELGNAAKLAPCRHGRLAVLSSGGVIRYLLFHSKLPNPILTDVLISILRFARACASHSPSARSDEERGWIFNTQFPANKRYIHYLWPGSAAVAEMIFQVLIVGQRGL